MKPLPQYRREFPDFDRELPVVPGFEDNSWHNDACPHLIRTKEGRRFEDLVIWCNYANPELREFPDSPLYLLQDVRDWECPRDICGSDNIETIIDAVAAFDLAH